MQSLKNLFKKSFTSTFIGDLIEQRSIAQWYQSKYESIPSLEEAINSINNRWSITLQDDKEQPIFIFSAGWRSGSTLLQRIVNSDSDTLIWGEPFAESNFIQKLANSIQVFREKEPAEYYFLKSLKNKDSLAGRWTANLYPNINYLFQSHRNFFLTLYAQSAREYGFTRWGFKEVRLTLDHAVYLKWLFPNAKFLFLYRDPYKCYQSCYTWRNLYWTWPNEPVIGPEEFGRHWLEQVIQFTRDFEKVNGYLIKYEDLCGQKLLIKSIGNYLETKLDQNIMDYKIGSSTNKIKPAPKSFLKRLERIVSPVAESLGYFYPN